MSKKSAAAESAPAAPLTLGTMNLSTWVRALVCVQLCLLAWQFSPALCNNGDNARYLILGQALIEDKGYRNIQQPDEPIEAQYPILFPALIGFAELFSDNFILPKIVISFIGVLGTLLFFYLFKDHPPSLLRPLLLVVASSGLIAEYSSILMSEVPYLFFVLIALYLRDKSVERPANKTLFWLTIVISVAPVHCRSIGLAFSAAWIASNIWSGHYRYAVMHAMFFVLTLIVFRSFVPTDPYFVQLIQRNSYDPEAGFVTPAEMGSRILTNIGKYGGLLISNALIPFAFKHPPYLSRLLATLCAGCVAVGWIRTFMAAKQRILGLYVFFYFCILCMWQPQWSGERFLVSIIPFLYVLLFYGLDAVLTFYDISRPQEKLAFFRKMGGGFSPLGTRRKRIVWGVAVAVTLFNLHYTLVRPGWRSGNTSDWRNYYSCADWVRIHTPANTVVMSRKPELFYMRARRKGLGYPFTHDVEKVIEAMEKNKVTYVVHDNFAWTRTTSKYLYPAIAAHPERFKIVYALKDPDTFVMEFLPQ